ncbi:C6 zinc finger domain-containing protein [Colletotrichum tofieldiae]|uniref:C6 zinc finger domain-containing protein n=1 Tax=Colletotrichum tofieldiae TaxID=708197 RepID=A0A166TZE8_9PEZI|nr:C6 zinc finger domain-containing protein [Colletotrichum tofieldiae]
MEPGYETSLFSDPKERVYFDFWLQLVANIYLFPNDIMHRVVPQLARQEPAIKHAALAMAGMARALVPSLVHRSEKELHNNGPHYEFALQQYGRAIKLVRSSKPSSENMLWAIVCCVLFVTFECLHGDRTAALSHMNHAYKMMETYFSQRSLVEDGRVTESIRTVCDDAAWIFQGLTMQAWSHNVLHSKDLSEISWCCRGNKTAFAVEEMPPKFTDIHMARRWWRVVQHHTCHRCPIYTEIYVDGLSEDMLVSGYVRPALSPTHSEKLVAVLPEFLNHLRKWSTAFQGIYDELRSHQHLEKADYHLYVDACNLRLQYLTLWNEVSSLSYTDIRVVIILTPSFREIVQLSRTILRAQSNCGGCSDTFSMDNGPTWPLLVTACRCRDANLRQEATELLGKYHRRDGLWDSRIFHGVAKRNMGIEMENVMTGDEYEQWSRMSRRELRFSRNGEVTGRLFKWDTSRSQWLHVEEPLATTSDAKLSREL